MYDSGQQSQTVFPAGPAMKAVLFFASGTAVGTASGISPATALAAGSSALLLFLAVRKRAVYADIAAALLLGICGMTAATIERESSPPLILPQEAAGHTARVEGIVIGTGSSRYGGTNVTLDCRTIEIDDKQHTARGILPCIVEDPHPVLTEGSAVSLSGTLKRYRRPIRSASHSPFRLNTQYTHTHRLIVRNAPQSVVVLDRRFDPLGSVRRHILESSGQYRFGGHAPLLFAMTLGERSGLPDIDRAVFARSGVAHILAVSGLHVGILATAVYWLLGLFPIPAGRKRWTVITVMILYASICGFRPPVVRAVIMLALVYGAIAAERPRNVENSIFIALLFILALSPSSLFGPSLQLSFTAVWGIMTFYTPIRATILGKRKPPRIITYTVNLIIISAVAQAVTAPVTAAHFGALPLYGIPANLVAVPLAFFIVTFGIAAIAAASLGAFLAPVATVLSFATGLLLKLLASWTSLVAEMPFAAVPLAVTPLAAFAATLWFVILSRAKRSVLCLRAAVYMPLVVLLIWTWLPLAAGENEGMDSGSVVFFDVGQGDAALVTCGTSRFLIDTGPRFGGYDAGREVVVPGLVRLGVDSIDGLIVSHAHDDHTGGIGAVLDGIHVKRIYCTAELAETIRGIFDADIMAVSAGDSIAFDGGGIIMLSPVSEGGIIPGDENDASLTLRFDAGSTRALFTGDIGGQVQRRLVPWGCRLDADVLKTPHHGGRGLDEEFLKAVSPHIAVVSCGTGNRYGHPSPETMAILTGCVKDVRRTDHDGTVVVRMPSLTTTTY